MNNQTTISPFQAAILLLVSMTGSSLVLIPGRLIEASGNGAWIALILSWGLGLLLLLATLYLNRQYPGMIFIEYSQEALGRFLTYIIAIPFLLTLFYHVSVIVVEIGGFFKSTMLNNTPTAMINAIFIVMAALTVRAGIEAMGRMFVLLGMLMFGLTIAVLLLVWSNYNPNFLLPVLPDGFLPVLRGVYLAYGFPYVEVILFATIFPFIGKGENRRLVKYVLITYAINGITLLLSIICTTMALGPLAGTLKYSLYQLARLIYMQQVIERIESVIGFSLIVGSYMKSSIMLFILSITITRFFKIKHYQRAVYPVALICYLLTVTMYIDEVPFVEDAYYMWTFLINITYVLPFLLILGATVIKRIRKRN